MFGAAGMYEWGRIKPKESRVRLHANAAAVEAVVAHRRPPWHAETSSYDQENPEEP